MTSSEQQRLSDQLVRLVQVFFALVLAQSLVLFRSSLLHPFDVDNRIAVLALVCVFYTTVASWIDWHVAMARRPYDTRQLPERFRVYADVGISMLYAYLLFTVEPVVKNPGGDLAQHLLGYPLIFASYLVSGLLRRFTHGRGASKPTPLFIGFLSYLLLVTAYRTLRERTPADLLTELNAGALVGSFILMFTYRAYRRQLVQRDEKAAVTLAIGVDVDGVLADQITGVLPRITERQGVVLTYADVTDWRLPIKNTDIAQEIVNAQSDRAYVIGMPVHEGARRVLKFLKRAHRIIVITARQGEAATTWTGEWLKKNKLPYDDVVAGTEAKKSEHRTDVLIDDYIGNISEFLASTSGVAVLVDQPWNRKRSSVQAFIDAGRLFVVSNLLELRMLWPEVVAAARAAKAAN